MKLKKPRGVLVVIVTGILALVGTSSAIATHNSSHVPYASAFFHGIGIWTNSVTFSGSSTYWQLLPGSFVPVAENQLVVARFTAESTCYSSTPGDWCSVRIVALPRGGGTLVELKPASDDNFRFDTVSSPNDSREAHALDRTIRLGSVEQDMWDVYVQWKTATSGTRFNIDDWHFSVETYA